MLFLSITHYILFAQTCQVCEDLFNDNIIFISQTGLIKLAAITLGSFYSCFHFLLQGCITCVRVYVCVCVCACKVELQIAFHTVTHNPQTLQYSISCLY